MKRKFVDTNIFLELLVRRGEKHHQCKRLFERTQGLWTTTLVIVEIEWVLRSFYEATKPRVVEGIRRLLGLQCLEMPDRDVLMEALRIYEEKNVDFTDCINAVLARKEGIDEAYSYDRDFEKMGGIQRLEPIRV